MRDQKDQVDIFEVVDSWPHNAQDEVDLIGEPTEAEDDDYQQ